MNVVLPENLAAKVQRDSKNRQMKPDAFVIEVLMNHYVERRAKDREHHSFVYQERATSDFEDVTE